MAAADPNRLGDVLYRNIMGIIELNILDSGQHILTAGRRRVGHGFARFLHQLGHEQVQVAGHQGFALRFRAAGQVDIINGFTGALGVFAVVHGLHIAERGLLHQLVGTRAVKADPVIFPRVGFICRIGDELIGFGEEEISLLQIIGSAVDLIHTFARNNKMDQVMVTHTGAPGVARLAVFVATIKNGKLYIIGIALLIRLLCDGRHTKSLTLAKSGCGSPFCSQNRAHRSRPEQDGAYFLPLYQKIHQKSIIALKKDVYILLKFVILSTRSRDTGLKCAA